MSREIKYAIFGALMSSFIVAGIASWSVTTILEHNKKNERNWTFEYMVYDIMNKYSTPILFKGVNTTTAENHWNMLNTYQLVFISIGEITASKAIYEFYQNGYPTENSDDQLKRYNDAYHTLQLKLAREMGKNSS